MKKCVEEAVSLVIIAKRLVLGNAKSAIHSVKGGNSFIYPSN